MPKRTKKKPHRKNKRPASKNLNRRPSRRRHQQLDRRSTKRWDWSRLVALIAALAAVGATAVGYLSYRTTQRGTEVTELAQLEDRLNRAIEKLGDPNNVTVRVGGIDQLVSLLKVAPSYHDTIVDQLSIFVRNRAPLSECNKDHGPTPDDVQHALTALGTHTSVPDKTSMKFSVDLSHTCLQNANMSTLRFPRANFTGTSLNGAEMSGVEMPGAVLYRTQLDRTLFIGGDLTCTIMTMSSVKNAMMVGVKLTGADLMWSDFEGTALLQADLTNAVVEGAALSESQLSELVKPLARPQPYCFPPDQYGPMIGKY
jgi:hypothetical protein